MIIANVCYVVIETKRSIIIMKISAKEFKPRHDWMGKVIHWELGKKLKFDPMDKWYLHNQESIQDNETHKIFWDFEIQTDHLISTRRPDLVIVNNKNNKKNLPNSGIYHLDRKRSKIKRRQKRDRYLDLARGLKISTAFEGDRDTNCNRCSRNDPQELVNGLDDLEIKGQVETIQITTLLGLARILRRVLGIWEDLLSLQF